MKRLITLIFGVMLLLALAPTPNAYAVTLFIVPDNGTLAQGLTAVSNGGVIELRTGSYASPGTQGWQFFGSNKTFTIRPVSGNSVTLTGQNNKQLFQLIDNTGTITFENLTMTQGYSNQDGAAGGLTIIRSKVVFKNVSFTNNRADTTTGGGAVYAYDPGTQLVFNNCTFSGNISQSEGGAVKVATQAIALIAHSTFTNNSVAENGHRNTAAGGAISVINATANITFSYFENNRAGYVGGAVYALGSWTVPPYSIPQASVTIGHSVFVQNQAVRTAWSIAGVPTEAGAVHVEDQAVMNVYFSRFERNTAENGGAANLYRATMHISDSIFLGNSVANASGVAFGGAISAISSGPVGLPTSTLTVKDTYIQGVFGGVTNNGDIAGGIYTAGNSLGSPLANYRANVTLTNVVFDNLVVSSTAGGGEGYGGALYLDQTRLIANNIIIRNSTANNQGGGAITTVRQTWITMHNCSIFSNSATTQGGAMFILESTVDFQNCQFYGNSIPGGTAGSVFYVAGSGSNGIIQNNVFTNNSNNAQVHSVVIPGGNSITVQNNTFGNPATPIGRVIAAPTAVWPVAAPGQPTPTTAYVTYAWTNGSATLNGGAVGGNSGRVTTTTGGHFNLVIDGVLRATDFVLNVASLTNRVYLPVLRR